MPWTESWSEPEVFIEHNGVTIWHVYKNDETNQGQRMYWYAFSPDGSDEGDNASLTFDVRTLPNPHDLVLEGPGMSMDNIRDVIRSAIDAGQIPPNDANERSEAGPWPIPYAATDDMTLGALIDLAGGRVTGYQAFTKWLEDYYDPAKSALIELLQQYDVVDQREDTQS